MQTRRFPGKVQSERRWSIWLSINAIQIEIEIQFFLSLHEVDEKWRMKSDRLTVAS